MNTVNLERILSPLRYPGSKSKVLKRFLPYFVPHKEYREPFFGGGSIFFGKPKVPINWLNDKDPMVSNFFRVIRDEPEQLKEMVRKHKPSIELWKTIKFSEPSSSVEAAFMFLFLNRTNYSGILSANPIGGLNQDSEYKIDCRWNSEEICRRIDLCSLKLQETTITNVDYKELITARGEDVLIILDPPYYKKGKQLYNVFMTPEEHEELANLLRHCNHKFLLTIDDCKEVRDLYSWAPFINQEEWYYSLTSKTNNIGKELFISNFDIRAEIGLFKGAR
jgi:DNA adenine methylase